MGRKPNHELRGILGGAFVESIALNVEVVIVLHQNEVGAGRGGVFLAVRRYLHLDIVIDLHSARFRRSL